MKILMIIPFIPYPLDSGGNQAFFSMVDYLKELHEISLIFPAGKFDGGKISELEKAWDGKVRLRPYHNPGRKLGPFPRVNTYLNLLSYLNASSERKMKRWTGHHIARIAEKPELFKMTSVLYNGLTEFSDSFMQFVHELCEKESFDCVQVEFYSHFPFKMLFPAGMKTIFVQHEIQFVRIANEMSLFNEVTWNDRVLYERKKNEELAELGSFDHIITLTETDRDILSKHIPADRISVSPAVISSPEAVPPFKECGTEFAFVGGSQHNPNLDAMVWFCHSVIPLLREKGFAFRLHVVGRWKRSLVRAFSRKFPELNFTGYVADIAEFLNGKISVVPVRIGSGMRIKILESIHSMSPFITTAKGVEGQDFRHGEECLICDTAEAFASTMAALAADSSLQKKLAGQALDKLRTSYASDELLRRRAMVYEKLAEKD